MSRRGIRVYNTLFVFLVLLTGAVLNAGGARAAPDLYPGAPPSGTMAFRVLLEGDSVGLDRFHFQRNGDTLVVNRRIRIDVPYLLVAEYEYRHKSREVWHDGRLKRLTSRTRDGDESHEVFLARRDGSLVIQRGRGSGTVPTNVLPTSWWHHGILTSSRLFDTQRGRLLRVRVRRLSSDPWPGFNPRAVRHYRVEGGVSLTLGYDRGNRLVGMSFRRRGYVVRYRRIRDPVKTGG